MKRILAISGSARKQSTNGRILEYLKEQSDQDFRIFEGVQTLPHFSEDLDRDPPAAVQQFRKDLEECDGVLICSPEYVFALPGSFKNALDWLVSTIVLLNKPLAMIVAAASGEEAFRSLRKICETLGASIAEESALLVSGARGKMDASGQPGDELQKDLLLVYESLRKQIQTAGK